MEIQTVDYHTAGEPFRIVVSGVEQPRGTTILNKRRYALEHLDHIRKLLIHEPRGHADMYGCFVTDPEDERADLGAVFFHNAGYSTACGHGTIALVTWALEHGLLPRRVPETRVVVDVPSGRVPALARVSGAKVTSVRFTNVPSFVYETGLLVDTSVGSVSCDIAFGGAFYASVDAGALGLPVEARNLPTFIALGRRIKREIEVRREVVHPQEPALRDIYGVIFFDGFEGSAALTQRNVTIFADGEVDRSPCGSGTSARLALLDEAGMLPRGAELDHRSIVGTRFSARVSGDAEIRSTKAVVTEVEGSAFMTGAHRFVLDPDDPLPTGFLLR